MIDLISRAVLGTKYQHRRDDLLAEGWTILFEHTDRFGVFTKLRHRNGSIIIITCDYGTGELTQKKNGKIVHSETMCKP